jgi:hypothetical protein
MDPEATEKFIPPDSDLDPVGFDAGFEAGHVWTLLQLAMHYYDAYHGFAIVLVAQADKAESMLLVAEDLDFELSIREHDDGLMEMTFRRDHP